MRSLSIRSRLALLVVATAAPLLIFMVMLVLRGSDAERALLQQRASGTVDAAMQAIDRELAGALAGLQVLAASPALARGDFASFHAQARAAVGIAGSSVITLYDRDGTRVVSTAVALGQPPTRRLDMSALAPPFETRRPHVSRLFESEAVKQPTLGLVVPVFVDGEVRYVLAAAMLSRRLTDLLRASGLPGTWIGTVLDQEGTIIARTRNPEAAVGKKALAANWERVRVAATQSGAFSGHAQEGDPVLIAFSKSEASGWTTVVGIPVAALDRALQSSLLWVAAIGVMVVAMALVLAWRAASAIYSPIERLQAAAEALEQGRAFEAPTTATRPFDQLAHAMNQAARRIREREAALTTSLVELQQAHQSLREEQVKKDQFIATLAHEMRNPLAPIRTSLHLLRKSPPPAAADRALAIMERQIGHVVKLIDDLLDVSRIARGKVSLRLEPVVLQTLLAEAVEALEPVFAAAGLTLTTAMETEPMWVRADVTRLNQVIGNLLDNAAKFTPAGGRVCARASREADQAVLRIEDTGIGIPADRLAEIFEAFAQLRDDRAPRHSGLGIGLSIARMLVRMHGGTLEASSAGPGTGTSFTVRLPLASPVPLAPGPQNLECAPASPARKVLVVDDNADAAETLVAALRASGHEADLAHDGPGALASAARQRFDLVLLDIGLPGMDGYEVCRLLRRLDRRSDTKIVALTGWGAAEHRQRAEAAGFDGHLTKPVAWPQIEEVLQRS